MKINTSHGAYELPDSPRNFDGGTVGTKVVLDIGGHDVQLAAYQTRERASYVSKQMLRAYLDGADEFTLPEEGLT